MFEDKILLLLIILLILVIVWAINSNNVEGYADITYNTNYNLQPGELIVAHASDNGTVHYYVVSTTPTMDYGFFKQKIDNHAYKFVDVIDPNSENDYYASFLNVIPNQRLAISLAPSGSKVIPNQRLAMSLAPSGSKVIPKIDLITGIPEYISKTSEEYKLVTNLRYHPEYYKLLYSEDVNDIAPYLISRRKEQLEQPVHDIFIQTIR